MDLGRLEIQVHGEGSLPQMHLVAARLPHFKGEQKSKLTRRWAFGTTQNKCALCCAGLLSGGGTGGTRRAAVGVHAAVRSQGHPAAGPAPEGQVEGSAPGGHEESRGGEQQAQHMPRPLPAYCCAPWRGRLRGAWAYCYCCRIM